MNGVGRELWPACAHCDSFTQKKREEKEPDIVRPHIGASKGLQTKKTNLSTRCRGRGTGGWHGAKCQRTKETGLQFIDGMPHAPSSTAPGPREACAGHTHTHTADKSLLRNGRELVAIAVLSSLSPMLCLFVSSSSTSGRATILLFCP